MHCNAALGGARKAAWAINRSKLILQKNNAFLMQKIVLYELFTLNCKFKFS